LTARKANQSASKMFVLNLRLKEVRTKLSRTYFPTAQKLQESDSQLKSLNRKKYAQLASEEAVARFKTSAEKKNYTVHIVGTKEEALSKLVSSIPEGSQVFSTGSTTLEHIKYPDYAIAHPNKWINLKALTATEKDPVKLTTLYRKAFVSDYVITSAAAVTENAEIITADISNTRVGPTMGGQKLIVVFGTQKIVRDMDAARERLHNYCVPLESARSRVAFGLPGSSANFIGELRAPNPFGSPGRITFIVLKEEIGY